MARFRAGLVACGLIGLSLCAVGCGGDDDNGGSSTGGKGGKGGTGGASGGSGGTGATDGGATGGTGGTAGFYDCSAATGSMPKLKLTDVQGGYTDPLIIETVPGDKARLFIGERRGVITIIKDGQKLAEPFLDISGEIEDGFNEQGLLGLAFHPDFAQNRKFYVHYTADGTTAPNKDTMIAEFTVMSDNPDKADPASEKMILTQTQPEINHNGGAIRFGQDGMLYIGLGDGGGAGDAHGTIGNGQSLDTLLGKILRIDVDNPASGKAYGIPSGNMTSGLPEIWSYGLRNPWRWDFDPCTGDMYIADVGQNEMEEVDVEAKAKGSGTNWGWKIMEGSSCFSPSSGCDQSGLELPVAEYSHSDGCSVTGGHVYRGADIPGLRGTYIYADYCSKKFWAFTYSGGAATNKQEITADLTDGVSLGSGISSFGQDQSGEIYVATFNDSDGHIWRVTAE